MTEGQQEVGPTWTVTDAAAQLTPAPSVPIYHLARDTHVANQRSTTHLASVAIAAVDIMTVVSTKGD